MGAHQFILFKDGAGVWCAAPPGFRDAVVDPAGWGATREEAVWHLIRQREFQERAHRERWPDLTVADFVEVADLEDAQRRRKAFRLIAGGRVCSPVAPPPGSGVRLSVVTVRNLSTR
jgi:hypothetical protein